MKLYFLRACLKSCFSAPQAQAEGSQTCNVWNQASINHRALKERQKVLPASPTQNIFRPLGSRRFTSGYLLVAASRLFRPALTQALIVLILSLGILTTAAAQESSGPQSAPKLEEWGDNFDGKALDSDKWELFSLAGGNGKVEVKDGQLRMRGQTGWRAGVRTKPTFVGDRFIVEGTVGKVGQALPDPSSSAMPIGNAILTILFDGSGRNRIEWILTSEGTFEAWSVVDGQGERLDNHKLATKLKNPTLGIVRKGDEFFFMLNGQEGLHATIKNLPRAFHVMLYGFSSSENNWDSVRVVTAKQS